jgi:hypothetical protein
MSKRGDTAPAGTILRVKNRNTESAEKAQRDTERFAIFLCVPS